MNPVAGAWQTFFAAQVGAAATLTGLAVVAVSVNLTRIMAQELLPSRALEALVALVGALVLAEGSDAGLYWAAVGVIMSLVAGVVGAWVLLVEILRWGARAPRDPAPRTLPGEETPRSR